MKYKVKQIDGLNYVTKTALVSEGDIARMEEMYLFAFWNEGKCPVEFKVSWSGTKNYALTFATADLAFRTQLLVEAVPNHIHPFDNVS